ncbi:MAG: triose-phosphate isomerase, partial [Dehalococcoidales bacterium]
SGEQANETAGLIRHHIASLYDAETARNLRILYGGSVKANNIAEYVGQPEIDGALVGGACIQAESFLGIVRQTQEVQGNPSGSKGP